jgi:HEAT repeat protein
VERQAQEVKSEIRMSKSETNPKRETRMTEMLPPDGSAGLSFGFLTSCFLLLIVSGCHWPGRTETPATIAYTLPPGTPQAQAEWIILEGLNDADPRIRVVAIEAVSAVHQTSLMPKIQNLLADREVPVRFSAAVAVGDLQYVQAGNAVASLLNDPDMNVQMAAGYAMVKLGRAEYSRLFRDAITSRDQTLRANAALLLGKSGDQEARKLLYWALQRADSDEKVVSQALDSIAMLRDERIYPKLSAQLTSANANDRIAGVQAMGLLGTAKAKNALATMLDDPAPTVRLAAAGQLGRLGDAAGEAEVQKALDKDLSATSDAQVETLMASAIAEIGTPSLVSQLPKLLRDSSQPVRLAAAKAVLQVAGRQE